MLFANNGPLEAEVLSRPYPEMFGGFGTLLFSYRVGHRNPDPAAFDAVTRHLDAAPDAVLFIDDSPANIDAARAFGRTAIPFRGPGTIKRALCP